MRLLARSVTLLLAAVGIKALYDRFVPRARELREPASQVLDSAKDSSREFAEHAKAAGSDVLADARDRSAEIRGVATDAFEQASSSDGALEQASSSDGGGSGSSKKRAKG